MSVITIYNNRNDSNNFDTWDTLYSEESLILKRSVYSLDLSDITIKQKAGFKVDSGDYIRFFFENFEIFGRVNSAENQENYIAISFSWGIELYQRHVFLEENSQELINFQIVDGIITTRLNDTFNVISTDHTLYSDQIFRQAYRKKHYIESYNNFTITGIPSGMPEYNVRLDDPSVEEYTKVVEFSDDTINELTLYNNTNLNQFTTYYLEDNGTVVTTGQNIYKRRNNEIQIVQPTEWLDLQFAKDILLKQEYSNSIEITTGYPFMKEIELNKLIGLRCIVWYNESPVRTFVSEFELKENILTIKFGLSNSNLTRMLKGD